MLNAFKEHFEELIAYDSDSMTALRSEGIKAFEKLGFPTQALEKWKSTSLKTALLNDFEISYSSPEKPVDINNIFKCEIHNFETYLFTQQNQNYIYSHSPLTIFENGIIAGSFLKVMKLYPDLFAAYYSKKLNCKVDGLIALNTAFAQDGFFIYVPDNVQVEKPVQMVHLVNTSNNVMIHPRNLVILGKNSKLTLLQCDDSINHQFSFINAVSEYYLAENAVLDHHKLQNKDDKSVLYTHNFFYLEDHSRLSTNTLSLNGGLIRNETHVCIDGEYCDVNAYGLYLVDHKQHVDSQIFVEHLKPNSNSNELYKGIIDDEATAAFNGHVLVKKDAQKTNAFQRNKNILLTDHAKVDTKPFLEIYADDVKCSHGATVGQLDSETLFYLRSRGICERTARMLLMYAFGMEVVNKITIEVLRSRIDKMVEKRLKGELSICDQCMLHCKDEKEITFNIDLSKI